MVGWGNFLTLHCYCCGSRILQIPLVSSSLRWCFLWLVISPGPASRGGPDVWSEWPCHWAQWVHGLLEGHMSLVQHKRPDLVLLDTVLCLVWEHLSNYPHHSITLGPSPHGISWVYKPYRAAKTLSAYSKFCCCQIWTHPQCFWQNNSLKGCGGVKDFMDFK